MADADRGVFGLMGAAALMMPATVVVAADYLTIDAAQKSIFPSADSFEPFVFAITAEQRSTIAALAGAQPPHGALRVWKASKDGTPQGFVLLDEVIGRSDLITYAIGVAPDGALTPVEILSYRESHGAEIRNAAWRRQFANRHDLSELEFRTDIKNISGATLSSEHVTQGVRWLLALWATVLHQPPSHP
jgi:Na+-translocating ferredoxin:NAD+ oxidoreductase RnfG subunit